MALELAGVEEPDGVAEEDTELDAECAGVACLDLLCCRHSCCPLARSASPIAPWSPECW